MIQSLLLLSLTLRPIYSVHNQPCFNLGISNSIDLNLFIDLQIGLFQYILQLTKLVQLVHVLGQYQLR